MLNLLPTKYKNVPQFMVDLQNRPGAFWEKRGFKRALEVFRETASRVPAYKDFLKKNRIVPAKIKSLEDFRKIPTIDKSNYLRQYPLSALSWDGKLVSGQYSIAATSGSTGEPFYFPRTESQDLQYAGTAELYLRNNFDLPKKKTLYVNAFPMGIWIGGVFTYEAITTIARTNKFPLSIINPGIDKKGIIKSICDLGPMYDQVLVGCYGPFLKDVLDEGVAQGVDWSRYNLKFIFSAEGFSEDFRDYVMQLGGLKNPYLDTLNHYGTVDQGTLAYETPLAIWARRKALENKSLYSMMFKDGHRLPTLAQYDPELFYFEEIDEGLICTAASGLPLVRYDLKDNGGVTTFSRMENIFSKAGESLQKGFAKTGIKKNVWQLPFVHVYERKDFSVSFYAFQIYPETIRRVVQQPDFRNYLTGKFTMMTSSDSSQNPVLEVHLELKKEVSENGELSKIILERLVKALLRDSSEYRETYAHHGKALHPRITFWKYEDPSHFRPGGKQKWTKTNNNQQTK